MGKNDKYRSRDHHGYWETIKSLPDFKTKVEYTWENWNVQILAVAFLIFLVSSVMISNIMNHENVYLNGDFINVLLVQEAEEYEEDYLQRAFIQDYLQADPKEELIIKYTADLLLELDSDSAANAMIGGDNSNSTSSTITKLDAQIMSGEVDYFFMTRSVVHWLHSRYGETFLDLSTFLTEDELSQYADRLIYALDGTPIAIDLTGSEIISKMGIVAESEVCFSWFAFVEETERMRPFFDFVMGTLP